MSEQWQLIENNRYMVSDTGKVVSLSYNKTGVPKELSALRLGGYRAVNIKRKLRTIHRLVVQAFIGPIPDGMQVNHKNGVKDDNRLSNLEIVTRSENTLHAYRALRIKPSASNRGNKWAQSFNAVSINQFNKNMEFIKTWYCIREAAQCLQISETGIANCLNGRSKTSGGYIWQYV